MEASEETGSNGFSITSDGKHFHIPKLLVQHIIRSHNGEVDPDNILGNSVESAIRVVEKSVNLIQDNLCHSKPPVLSPSIIMKVVAVFQEKLHKMRALSNGFSITSDGKHFHIPKLLVQHAIKWYNGEVDPP